MAIGFTGTQKGLTQKQRDSLFLLLNEHKRTDFRHGDCIGADAEAHIFARNAGHKIIIHPPIDKSKQAFCRGDGYVAAKDYLDRNHDIVRASQWIIACPKGFAEELRSGTWATIRFAKKLGKRLTIIWPDGSKKEC